MTHVPKTIFRISVAFSLVLNQRNAKSCPTASHELEIGPWVSTFSGSPSSVFIRQAALATRRVSVICRCNLVEDTPHSLLPADAAWFTVPLWRLTCHTGSQWTGNVGPMLGYCWASVCDAGPTVTQHWFKVLRFLGYGGKSSFQQVCKRPRHRPRRWADVF